MHVCMYACPSFLLHDNHLFWSDPPHGGGSGSIGDGFRQGEGSISICFIIDIADVEVAVGLVASGSTYIGALSGGLCHPRVPLDEHVVHIAQTSSE